MDFNAIITAVVPQHYQPLALTFFALIVAIVQIMPSSTVQALTAKLPFLNTFLNVVVAANRGAAGSATPPPPSSSGISAGLKAMLLPLLIGGSLLGLTCCATISGLQTDLKTGAGLFATASNPSTPAAAASAAWSQLVGLIQTDNPQVQALVDSACGLASEAASAAGSNAVNCAVLLPLEQKVNAEVAALSTTSAPQSITAAFQDLQNEAIALGSTTKSLSPQTQADLQAGFDLVKTLLPLLPMLL